MASLTLATTSLMVILPLLMFYYFVKRATTKSASIIPGLQPSDKKLGNLPDLKAAGSLHEFLSNLHGRFGDLASFWFGELLCISVASSKLFKEVQVLFDRPPILFDFFEPLITSKGITYANGADGKRRHKILSEAFTAKATANLLPAINKVCREFSDNWELLPIEEHIALHESMMVLAVTGITTAHFGVYFKDGKKIPAFIQNYLMVWNEMEAKLAGDFTEDQKEREERLQANLKKFHEVCHDIIGVQKKARESGDYESAPFLNAVIDNSTDEQEEFSDSVAFMFGGFHSSGNLLTWLFYYMCLNPDVQEKLRLEIVSVLDGGKIELDQENFKKLRYVRQVIDETLRCSNLAPYGARVSFDHDLTLGGHVVPKGTPVVFATGVVQEDGKVFPNPERFDPERFSSSSAGLSLSPFGLGQRRCPGYLFAIYEVYSAVCSIVPRFEVRLAPQVEPGSIGKNFGLITGPSSEIWIQLKKRT